MGRNTKKIWIALFLLSVATACGILLYWLYLLHWSLSVFAGAIFAAVWISQDLD